MGRWVGALLLTGLLLASCAPTASPPPATATILPTPTLDPFPILLEMGHLQAASGERTEAETNYWEAAALRPSDATPYLYLAQLYLDWNRPQEGLAMVDTANQFSASPAQVAALRVALYTTLEDWEAVLTYGTTALTLGADDSTIRHQIGWAYLSLGRLEDAQAQYQLLLENTDDPLAHQYLGILLIPSHPEVALFHLQAAGTLLSSALSDTLQAFPDSDPAYRMAQVGQICLAHQEWVLGKWALEQAIEENPAYAEAYALLGQALSQLGHPQALSYLEVAVALDPDSTLTRSLLGNQYLQHQDPVAARAHLEAAYDLEPDNPAFSLYLAQVYADLGQYTAAEVWLAEAIRLAPQDPIIWEAVVNFYLQRGWLQGSAGLEMAQAFVQVAPLSGTAHQLLGWAHFLNGQYASAEEHLLQASQLDSTDPTTHYYLGQLYLYQGQTEKARGIFTRALDLNTDPYLRVQIAQTLSELP